MRVTSVVAVACLVASLVPTGEKLVHLPPALQVLAIIAGTLISEDLTCITVGTLISHREISWVIGGVSCFLGIYIGDLTFFFLGRLFGGKLLKLKFFSRGQGSGKLAGFGEWFDRRPWAAILAARFLPGLRVPLYVSIGALTKRTAAFFWWTCFFAFVWTPALIGLVALVGEAFTRPFERIAHGKGWLAIILAIAAMYLIVRTIILMTTHEGRIKLYNRVAWIWGDRKPVPGEDPPQPRGFPVISRTARANEEQD